MKYFIYTFCFSLVALSSCRDARIVEHKNWDSYFTTRGLANGSLIVRDNNHESIHYFNKEGVSKRQPPGNTFDYFNSMVAFETAVANDDQLAIAVDTGQTANNTTATLTMRQAINARNMVYFQQLAQRIGAPRLQKFLDSLEYGSKQMDKTSSFWTNGSLTISADEQVGLVKRIYFHELAISERSQRIAKTLLEQDADKSFSYTSSIVKSGRKEVYTMIGFVEYTQKVKEKKEAMNKSDIRTYPYFFALNCDAQAGSSREDLDKKSMELVRNVLKDYGAYNSR
jgi:beta-lactamase class D